MIKKIVMALVLALTVAQSGVAVDAQGSSGINETTGIETTDGCVNTVESLASSLASNASFGTRNGGFPWDSEKKTWSWTYYNGIMMDAYMMLGDAYVDRVIAFYDANINSSGRVDATGSSKNSYKENELDSIPPTRPLFDLLRLGNKITSSQRTKYIRMIEYVYDLLAKHAVVSGTNGNFQHKMNNDGWKTYPVALDGLYMAQPFFMELANAIEDGVIVNNDINPEDLYVAVIGRMAWIGENLYDETTHLYNHGWGPSVGVNHQYWLRAVGWYAAALADVIGMLPENSSNPEIASGKKTLIEHEKRLFDGMMEWQDADTGMWHNVINHGTDLVNGTMVNKLESSGSALLAYAMMKSYAEGYVGYKYGEAGIKAFNGTVLNKVKNNKLTDVYKSSGVKTRPEEYLASTFEENEAKGVGPLIMASTYADDAADRLNRTARIQVQSFVDGKALPGVTLKVTGVDTWTSVEDDPLTTDIDESVHCIENLSFGTEYTLSITHAPNGYQVPASASFTLNGNGVGSATCTLREDGVMLVELASKATDDGIEPEFNTCSLILSGQIGVNFYMSLPQGDAFDYSNSYMEFMLDNKKQTWSYDKSFMNKNGTLRGFRCYTNAIEMADKITAVFHYVKNGAARQVQLEYTIKDYVNSTKDDMNLTTAARDVIKAIGDYGHYAQVFLSQYRGWTIGVEHAEMPRYNPSYTEADHRDARNNVQSLAYKADRSGTDIKQVTYSLYLDTDTSIYIYLQMAQGFSGEVSADLGSTPLMVEKQKDGRYRVVVPSISAHRLGNMNAVNITAGNSTANIQVSALSYVQYLMNLDNPTDAQKNFATSLYRYYVTATAYNNSLN